MNSVNLCLILIYLRSEVLEYSFCLSSRYLEISLSNFSPFGISFFSWQIAQNTSQHNILQFFASPLPLRLSSLPEKFHLIASDHSVGPNSNNHE